MNKKMQKVFGAAVLTAALLCVSTGYAQRQRYPYVQDGKIVVCREGNDGVKASLIHPRWIQTPIHNEADRENNRFGAKFQVASANAVDKDGNEIMYWDQASGYVQPERNPTGYVACANYTEASDDKGTWRLPTVRELRLIYALRDELTAAKLPTNNNHWCATRHAADNWTAIAVHFLNGQIYKAGPNAWSFAVRCVRDL